MTHATVTEEDKKAIRKARDKAREDRIVQATFDALPRIIVAQGITVTEEAEALRKEKKRRVIQAICDAVPRIYVPRQPVEPKDKPDIAIDIQGDKAIRRLHISGLVYEASVREQRRSRAVLRRYHQA